jgi:GNAT superfamily N-acetyltransferase
LAVPESAQAHVLGAHVVGKRVVVRRVIRGETGPSGGPSMTDVLGVCIAWGDGVCVVAPTSGGEPVRIAIADIVSGKPVPPRPSPRLRVSPRDAQVRAFALFPDLEVTPVPGASGWLLRASQTASARRANSVLAFPVPTAGTSYDPVARATTSYDVAAVSQVEAYYAGVGKPAVAAVLGESEERSYFRSLGWVPESHDADTLFQLASVASVRRSLRSVDHSRVELTHDGAAATAVVAHAGDVVASGVAAYADDGVGFRGIEVSPDHRRQGLGRTVMAALLEWGAERGATTAYLQVLGHNVPALALYASMGFQTHHAYAYLTPA